jgi:hypothetical protein
VTRDQSAWSITGAMGGAILAPAQLIQMLLICCRHCERSEAIQKLWLLFWIAADLVALAMTEFVSSEIIAKDRGGWV